MKALLVIALLVAPSAAAHHEGHGVPVQDASAVTQSARELLAAHEARPPLVPAPLVHEFSDPQRRSVDFFPLFARENPRGVRLGIMALDERRKTHAFLRQVLSEEGYLRIQAIRSLEDVLRYSEVDTSVGRISDDYVVQLFGRPSDDSPWGFKLEGHHVSINVTSVGGELRGTPLFIGANPAEVRSGPNGGMRVLGPQEDLGRALLASLSDEQRARVMVGAFAPGETIPRGPLRDLAKPAGLPAAEMSERQRALLVGVIASYVTSLRPAFASEELARIEAAGTKALHFVWCGSATPGAPHYYRVQGPTVFIELDAIEDVPGGGANHVHALWRDPERDFGEDLLQRHYAESHGEAR